MNPGPKHNHSVLKLFLCLFFLNSSLILFAQKDYKWDTDPKLTEQIPEEFVGEDAVMIYEEEELLTTYDITRRIIKRRIKIQTELGLDRYARIVVPKQKYMFVSILDARTIKQDGSVVDLKAKDIKSIDLINDDDIFDKEEYYLFKVPGVEVGDEIEMISVYEGQVYYPGGGIILHSYLPVINAKFKLRINRGLPFSAVRYNGMPEPKTENTLNEFNCVWEAQNLPGLFDQRASIPYNKIPYSIYDFSPLRQSGKKSEHWDQLILDIDEQVSDVRIRSKKKLNAFYENLLGDKSNASKIEQAKIIHDYINREVRLTDIPESEQSNGIEYFLTGKKANFIILFNMYKNLMERLDLNYSIAIGRDRYARGFHIEIPALWQITHYLLLVEDDKGQPHIFPIKTGSVFHEVDEIPTELEGSTLLALDLQEKDSIKVFNIPFSNYKKNKRLRKIKTNVQLNENKITYNFSEKMYGAVSTETRHFYYDAQQDGELSTVFKDILSDRMPDAELVNIKSSEMPGSPPFLYSLNYEINRKDQVTKLDESVYSLSLKNLFSHKIYPVNAKDRILDYHPICSNIDTYNYYLQFDQPVRLANKKNLDVKIDNQVGTYELNVNQINDKAISIRSKYIIKVNQIPIKSIQLLTDLNEAVMQADAQGLLIELVGDD